MQQPRWLISTSWATLQRSQGGDSGTVRAATACAWMGCGDGRRGWTVSRGAGRSDGCVAGPEVGSNGGEALHILEGREAMFFRKTDHICTPGLLSKFRDLLNGLGVARLSQDCWGPRERSFRSAAPRAQYTRATGPLRSNQNECAQPARCLPSTKAEAAARHFPTSPLAAGPRGRGGEPTKGACLCALVAARARDRPRPVGY